MFLNISTASDQSGGPNTISGWTTFNLETASIHSKMGVAFWKFADSTDVANSALGGQVWVLNIQNGFILNVAFAAWTDVDTLAPFLTGPSINATASTTPAWTSQTAPSAGSIWVGSIVADNNGGNVTDPGPPPVRQVHGNSSFLADNCIIYSKSVGAGAVSYTGGLASGFDWATIAFILSPAASGGSIGSSAGTATVAGIGASTVKAVGSSSGAATVAGVAKSNAASSGSSTGTSTAAGTAASTASSVGSSGGTSTANAVGQGGNAAAGSSTGTSTAAAVGRGNAASVGSSGGTSSASAVGASTAKAVGTSAGTSTAAGTTPVGSIAASHGTSTAAAVGKSTAQAVGSSGGSSTAIGVSGTIIFTSGLYLLANLDTSESYEEHFVNNGWASPQAQVDAGYPYLVQPTPMVGTYTEIIDYGLLLSSLIVTITYNQNQIFGNTTVVIDMQVSSDGISYSSYVSGAVQFYTSFRYLRFRLTFTGDTDEAILVLSNLQIRLDVKREQDGGVASVLSSDTGGTTVTFNKAFRDIDSVTATPMGTTDLKVVIDFLDIPDPTDFKVYLFDTAGVRASGDVRWIARGVV